MVILAVDFGDVRTGIACCDREEHLAFPVGVIVQRNIECLVVSLIERAKQLGAGQIVVGLPKNMDGSEGFRAKACREFALRLEEKSGIEVVLRDERLTTVGAHKYMNLTNTRGEKRKKEVDAVSAVIILEDYLRYRKNSRRAF